MAPEETTRSWINQAAGGDLRRDSQPNRPDRSAATQVILISIYRALHLCGLNPTQTIADALRTYLATGQRPPLPDAALTNH